MTPPTNAIRPRSAAAKPLCFDEIEAHAVSIAGSGSSVQFSGGLPFDYDMKIAKGQKYVNIKFDHSALMAPLHDFVDRYVRPSVAVLHAAAMLPPHFPDPNADPIALLEAALTEKDEIIAGLYAEMKGWRTQLEAALARLDVLEAA